MLTALRGTVVRAALIGALALASVLICASLVGIQELHFDGLGGTLNDQFGYITTARNLVETGLLDSEVIYPSVLTQTTDKDYLYMPGYYLTLAATYAIFGFGNIRSLLPSMLAYVVGTIALFLAIRKLYGMDVATISALLFAFFPANLAYALTAMVEPMLTAALLVSLAIFIYLPTKVKVALGPLLLALPMVFRETGAVVGLPFASLILLDHGVDPARSLRQLRWKPTALFLVLAAVAVTAVLKADFSDGRPSLEPLILISKDEGTIYNDAYFFQSENPGVPALLAAPFVKFAYNARQLVGIFAGSARSVLNGGPSALTGADYLELVCLGMMLAGVPLSALAIKRRPRDSLLIGGLAAVIVLLVAILGQYFVRHFQAVRILLIGVPFECVAGAVLLSSLPRVAPTVRFLVVGLAVALGMTLTVAALRPTDAERTSAQRDLEFMQGIHSDNRFVLVTPTGLPFDYLYAHYPVRWASVPFNAQTLKLLDATYPVGTVVVDNSSSETELTAGDLAAEGLHLFQTTRLDGHEYAVYKR